MLDLCRYFWIREIGTGQQVAQLHERYIIIIIIIIIIIVILYMFRASLCSSSGGRIVLIPCQPTPDGHLLRVLYQMLY